MKERNILILPQGGNIDKAFELKRYLKKRRFRKYSSVIFSKKNVTAIREYISETDDPVLVIDNYNVTDDLNSVIGEEKPYAFLLEDLHSVIKTNDLDSVPDDAHVINKRSVRFHYPIINISFSSLSYKENFKWIEEDIREQSKRKKQEIIHV